MYSGEIFDKFDYVIDSSLLLLSVSIDLNVNEIILNIG